VREPIWIQKKEVLTAHDRQMAEHGGSVGIRDESLLESALAKPKNVFAYSDEVSFSRLAASYAFGIARNHPFVDGNKRAALIAAEGFLRYNGFRVIAEKEEKYMAYLKLAEGSLSEEEFTLWIEQHLEKMG